MFISQTWGAHCEPPMLHTFREVAEEEAAAMLGAMRFDGWNDVTHYIDPEGMTGEVTELQLDGETAFVGWWEDAPVQQKYKPEMRGVGNLPVR